MRDEKPFIVSRPSSLILRIFPIGKILSVIYAICETCPRVSEDLWFQSFFISLKLRLASYHFEERREGVLVLLFCNEACNCLFVV